MLISQNGLCNIVLQWLFNRIPMSSRLENVLGVVRIFLKLGQIFLWFHDSPTIAVDGNHYYSLVD